MAPELACIQGLTILISANRDIPVIQCHAIEKMRVNHSKVQ